MHITIRDHARDRLRKYYGDDAKALEDIAVSMLYTALRRGVKPEMYQDGRTGEQYLQIPIALRGEGVARFALRKWGGYQLRTVTPPRGARQRDHLATLARAHALKP